MRTNVKQDSLQLSPSVAETKGFVYYGAVKKCEVACIEA